MEVTGFGPQNVGRNDTAKDMRPIIHVTLKTEPTHPWAQAFGRIEARPKAGNLAERQIMGPIGRWIGGGVCLTCGNGTRM